MSMIFVDQVYTESILQQLWQDCENEEFCDVVLIAGSEELRIPAHRNILSAASSYFKGMFQSSMRESTAKEIQMSSVNGAILRSLIEYCYTGRVAITEKNAVELFKLADLLLLCNVLTACGNFLSEQLHPSNCLEFTFFAEQHSCVILLKKANDYSLEHFMDVAKKQEFLNLNSEQLGEFLASDNLNVQTEENVFEILMTWVQHDQIAREQHKDHLLKLVRLPLLKRSFLVEQVKPICTSIESQQLYLAALEWNCSPDNKTIKARKSIKPEQFLICLTDNIFDNISNQIHFYCPQRLKWMRCLKDLEWRFKFGLAIMHDNLYVVGGRSKPFIILNTVICINLKTMNIDQINPMTEHRFGCRSAVLNDFLYAVGGYNGSSTVSSVEKWDSKTNTWTEVASMSVCRFEFGIAQLNGKLYAVGGHCHGNPLKSAEYYDVDQNDWKSIAPMNECHLAPGVAVSNGLLYVVGDNNTVEQYDPQCNKWTILCSLPGNTDKCTLCTTFCNKVIVYSFGKFFEYNDKTSKWEMKEILNGITWVIGIIEYSGELPTSEFIEN